ncbi:MAG: manganese transporter permease [Gemmatimonadaceae bacterium]
MTADADARPRASLLQRLAVYQRERFPLTAYVPLIAIAATAGIAWSRAARDAAGFVSMARWGTGALTMLVTFFLLRVADEHKDAALDRVARPELPVPRGLITLAELRTVGLGLAIVVVALNAWVAPALLLPLLAVASWGALMTKEFFVAEWLRARHGTYLLSHMVVLALILLYATAVDWRIDGGYVPPLLAVFLAATYANGLVLEIGRKLRDPAAERPGVETYSAVWGLGTATGIWMLTLITAALLTAWAMTIAGLAPVISFSVSVLAVVLLALPARALGAGQPGSGKRIELRSAVWNLLAYVLLALPWALREAGR